MSSRSALLRERRQLMREILRYREALPGSFTERRITCGKPNCICMREGKKHRAYQWTYRLKKKTVGKMVPASHASVVKERVAMNKQLKAALARIYEINVALLYEEWKKR